MAERRSKAAGRGLKIETKKISELLPAEYNPRMDLKPEDLEYKKLLRSVKEFGCVEPIVWNKRTRNVIGGHQRLKVLKDLGYEDIDVSVVSLTEGKEKALNIALNKISGEWDISKLDNMIDELTKSNFDMDLTGFSEDELKKASVSVDDISFGDEINYDEEMGRVAVYCNKSSIPEVKKRLDLIKEDIPEIIYKSGNI